MTDDSLAPPSSTTVYNGIKACRKKQKNNVYYGYSNNWDGRRLNIQYITRDAV